MMLVISHILEGRELLEIEIYETEDGRIPFMEHLESLDPKMRAKVLKDMDLLEEFGTALRKPYSAPLGDGIFELRTKLGSNVVRTLYFFFVGSRAVITHGFVKKTQKTPKGEIERAKEYRADWLRRNR